MGMTAVFVLVTFVIPRFQELFDSFGRALPWPTQLLIDVSSFMGGWWWAVLAGAIGGVTMLVFLVRMPTVRVKIDRAILRLPVVGAMVLKLDTSRIARTLGALLHAGVDILSSLRITGQTARNRALRDAFGPMAESVMTGQSLAVAIENSALFPPLVVSLVRTGEETGELPEMLTELSEIYEDEAARAVNATVKLLEPILIIVIGGVIAAIVAAIMLPVFQANTMVG